MDRWMVPLNLILPPDNPMRQDTLEEGIQELCDDLQVNGQLQPVGLSPTADGYYRLIYGHRRCTALTMMGRAEVWAVEVEGTDEQLDLKKAAENNHRTQLNALEEGRWFKSHMERFGVGVAEMARRARCSPSRVRELLQLVECDPAVQDALKCGKISKAQALSIAKVEDEPGRRQALAWCISQGYAAHLIDRWREERKGLGIDQQTAQAVQLVLQTSQPDTKTQAHCNLCDEWIEYHLTTMKCVCNSCLDEIYRLVTEEATRKEHHDTLQ